MDWIVKGKGTEGIAKKIDIVTLHFFAHDGKAIAKYTSPDKNTEVEVTGRAHALALTRKAVANANSNKLPFRLEHGEIDESDPFRPRLTATCLSSKTYDWLKEIERTAEHNGLFKPSW